MGIGYDYAVQVLRTPEGSAPICLGKGKLASKFGERWLGIIYVRTRVKPECYRKNQVKTCGKMSEMIT
jgi:hypothetical protein